MNWEGFLASIKGERIDVVGPEYAPHHIPFAEPVIFVDGGVRFRKSKEGFAVGDGDSAPDPSALNLLLPKEKDFSDLAFTLANLPETITEVRLHGFLGGRLDHQFFNIGEACAFLRQRKRPSRVFFDDKIIAHSAGSWAFDQKGLFSLAVLEAAKVLVHGDVKYPIDPASDVLPLSSLGLSNVALGRFGIHSNKPFLILCEEKGVIG
jgi:thiamine pyrophosphokinase